MEGYIEDVYNSSPYYSLNPIMLHEDEENHVNNQLSYREIQLLCIELGLGGKGSRIELLNKLNEWNKGNMNNTNKTCKRRSSNNNLHLVDISNTINVNKSSLTHTPRKVTNNNIYTFTCPALNRRNQDGTPISILTNNTTSNSKRSAKRLSFSLLNEVKLIPQRHQIAAIMKFPTPPNNNQTTIDNSINNNINNSQDTNSNIVHNPTIPDFHSYTMEQLSNSFALLTTIS
jgi:hypothetical protein